jgi:glycosyltransferase involved in cell wall biosynthesis
MNVTLVIPSRNNLKYVKFAYNSIRTHLGDDVEVILLDDASTDGTWEWMELVKSEKTKIYKHADPNLEYFRKGHTRLYDIGAKMATNEVFGIFHADMIATSNYLKNMMKHVKKGTVVSGTRIEPPLHPPGPEKIVENFGLEPEEFQMTDFLSFIKIQEDVYKDKTTAGIFAPWIMYVEDFFAIGGHDKRVFDPMELEDSDLFNRFKLAGYQFIQARDAFVYHMTCRGSRFKDGVNIIQEIPVGGGKVWKRSKDSEEYTTLRQIKFKEWWRKWHMNVLHDEFMMPKVCKRYDVGYLVTIDDDGEFERLKDTIINIEPWCDTLYLNFKNLNKMNPSNIEMWSEHYYKKLIEGFCLQIGENEDYKKFLREKINSDIKLVNFDLTKRIKLYEGVVNNNVIIEFDIKNFYKKEHYQFIENLMFIIEESGEIGTFEYDIFKITIKSMESYEKNLIHADDPWYLSKLKQGI